MKTNSLWDKRTGGEEGEWLRAVGVLERNCAVRSWWGCAGACARVLVCALCARARAAVYVALQLWAWLGLWWREGWGCVPVFGVCTVGSTEVRVEGELEGAELVGGTLGVLWAAGRGSRWVWWYVNTCTRANGRSWEVCFYIVHRAGGLWAVSRAVCSGPGSKGQAQLGEKSAVGWHRLSVGPGEI